MNDKVEFDVIVNGKKAKKSLEEINSELKDLEKQDKDTTNSMKSDWKSVGASIASALGVIESFNSSNELSKLTFNFNDATKSYIRQLSELEGINQSVLAGFIQTGKAAGMSGEEIAKMIDQAVALGRIYPHESVETFIDNLTMLNTTGEAQGYIVDVLEQKWGAIDLKGKSLADKLKVIEERTKGVNEEFRKTSGSKIDSIMENINNRFSDFGNLLFSLADKSGALWMFNKAVTAVGLSINGYSIVLNRASYYAKKLFGKDAQQEVKEYQELLKQNEELWKTLAGVGFTEVKKPVVAGKEKPQEQMVIEQIAEADKKATEDKKKRLSEIEAYNKKVYSSMSDELMRFVDTGKVNFKSLAASILGDLLRIQIQKQMVGIFGASTPGGGIGGFFASMGLLHTGGAVGRGSNIPSYHTGMRSDERLAKLQVGESVVNRVGTANNASAIDAMNRGQKISGGGVVLNIENNTSQAIDAEMVSSMMRKDERGEEQRVINIVMKNAMQNSSFRSTMKGALG